jgi:type II secretory pathway pseudopilin PulG
MKRARKDSGFALLLVFLMAAMIAISLYMEMPRVAMESQRQKEQLLIVRGEEYKRAILVFFKATQRWPTKIDDLESFNNRRFLRRRYLDPMTGKDEWRLIHINNGVFTDSVTNKPKQGDQKQDASTAGQYVGVTAGMFDTSSGATGSTGPNLGRRRISDGGTGGGTMVSMDPSNPNGTNPPPDGSAPGAGGSPPVGIAGDAPGGATGPTGATGAPGDTNAGANPGNGPQPAPTAPGMAGQQPGQPPMPPGFPGMPGMIPGVPGAPVNSQTGGLSPTPYPTTPGANGAPPGFPQPGTNAQAPSAAQNMIQQILGSPRPGGAPGTSIGSPAGGLVIGGGIAGVASKADREGIMVYNDHTNYKEWEFIFDPTKWKPPPNPLAGAGTNGTPASQMGSMPQGNMGTSVNDIVAQQNGTATSTSGSAGANGSSGSTGATGTIIH